MPGLKLLINKPLDIQYYLKESNKDSTREMFIEGPYLMAEEENRNGRIYSENEMKTEVERYTEQMIKTGRAIGELNHPTSAEINPERACHTVISLKQEGNIWMGKSKILNGVPMGDLVKGLLLNGVKLGVSSRALGTLSETDGTKGNRVSNFHLICVDVVSDPSVHSAFVEGVLESKTWMLDGNGECKECMDFAYRQMNKALGSLPKKDTNQYIQEQIQLFLSSLRKM
jgi:hypothetical protein